MVSLSFGYVPPPFGAMWPTIAALLDRAVQRGKNDWREVEQWLADHRAQLWLTCDEGRPIAAMVTVLDGEVLEVWLAGGAVMAGSVPFLETAIAAARAGGARRGRIVGRVGWDRVLRLYGWRRDGDELVKDFD